ncbi:MAG: hypothetical protein PHY73_02610 [Candidatus Omnitrophica bacterium]|nr:hypothetical protein [Candidatus Omnitrophota bacterium]
MIKKIIIGASVFLLWANIACADFSFRGTANLLTKEVNLELNASDHGTVFFRGVSVDDRTIDFDLSLYEVKVLIFDISTALKGTAKVIERPNAEPFIRGFVGRDEQDFKTDERKYISLGAFEFKDDKFFLDPVSFNGLTARGYLSLLKPYDIDLSLLFLDVLLSDFLSWVNPGHNMYAESDISGKIQLSGVADHPFVDGKLSSYDGQIEDFKYDNIVLNFQGSYPIFELIQTSVTEQGGVSGNVEGTIDLSEGFVDFEKQIAKLKVSPLIRETDIQKEWTIKQQKGRKRESETQFKYRMRKDQGSPGYGEADMLTIQRSIKF